MTRKSPLFRTGAVDPVVVDGCDREFAEAFDCVASALAYVLAEQCPVGDNLIIDTGGEHAVDHELSEDLDPVLLGGDVGENAGDVPRQP